MDTGAIAATAMSMQALQLQQAVSTSILNMSMDTARDSSLALLDMMKTNSQAMEQSVNPHLGKVVDILG